VVDNGGECVPRNCSLLSCCLFCLFFRGSLGGGVVRGRRHSASMASLFAVLPSSPVPALVDSITITARGYSYEHEEPLTTLTLTTPFVKAGTVRPHGVAPPPPPLYCVPPCICTPASLAPNPPPQLRCRHLGTQPRAWALSFIVFPSVAPPYCSPPPPSLYPFSIGVSLGMARTAPPSAPCPPCPASSGSRLGS
jgi:hypothetical protein